MRKLFFMAQPFDEVVPLLLELAFWPFGKAFALPFAFAFAALAFAAAASLSFGAIPALTSPQKNFQYFA